MRRILTAGLILMAACASSQPEDDKDIISNRIGDWETSLNARNNSGVTGNVKVQSVGVGSGVTISIQGTTPNAQHLWHVHTGTCDAGGSIVGSMGDYPTLTANAAGSGSSNASIGTALRENERYAVNVHRSASDLTVVACGNLSND
jgi:hypothetical protein